MAIMSFVAMYILMYAMVDSFQNAYINVNQLYMVFMMTGAMMVIEICVMQSMYTKKVKIIVVSVSIVVIVLSFLFIRNQTAISDTEFLKSMITHHASAILMCEKATLKDPDIKKLCSDIISSQQSQINWMKSKL